MTLAEKLAGRPPSRLLVVQTAYIGDTVFTSALVSALAARFPRAEVDLCVAPRATDVARAIPAAGQVHVFDKRGVDRGLSGVRRMAARLASRQYPVAVLPHASPRSALLAWLARIPERVGFAGTAGAFLYTVRVRSRERPFVLREAELGAALGAAPAAMRLVPRPEWVAAAGTALAQVAGQRLAGICLGSEWPTKIWPVRHVTDLARRLCADGFRPVLLGGLRERDIAREVGASAACLDTTGNSVGEAMAILARCSLAVGGDSGLVHVARALGVPSVAVFGPTPSDVHVFGARERAVSLGLSCAPCSVHGSLTCPLGHHRCLADLDADRVAVACREVLA